MIKYSPLKVAKSHQAFGTAKMLEGTSLNFDDQGLGKTKQGYDLAAEMIRTKKVDLALFVVKSSLKDTILREVNLDADQLSACVISGSRSERAKKFTYLAHNVVVISYDNVVTDLSLVMRLVEQNRTLICFDESHYIKNHKAQRTIACQAIARAATKIVLFSGTPVPNKKEDLFPQLRAAGLNVGEDVKEFKMKFSSEKDLREYMVGKFVRRKKESVKALGIPEKRVRKIILEMSPNQAEIYRKVNQDLIEELEGIGFKKKILPISTVLTKLLRLIQISSNPSLVFEEFSEKTSKFKAIETMVDEICGVGGKVILWTSFRPNVDVLKVLLQKHGIVELHGGVKPKDKIKNSTLFNTDKNFRVMIATPQCAREGFTLTAASTAIYLDRNFSFLNWAQSQDRIHRISQTKICDVVTLINKDTIDEHIDTLLDAKGQLQAYLLGDEEKSTNSSKISVEKIINLLKKK